MKFGECDILTRAGSLVVSDINQMSGLESNMVTDSPVSNMVELLRVRLPH